MERELAERRAALRSLLIEQVESTAPGRIRSAPIATYRVSSASMSRSTRRQPSVSP